MKLNFSVGDYVDTKINGYAHIVDILKSDTSDRTAVCVKLDEFAVFVELVCDNGE